MILILGSFSPIGNNYYLQYICSCKMDQEAEYEDTEIYDNQEGSYDNDYDIDENYESVDLLSRQSSENKAHYLICASDRVLIQINEEIKQVMNLGCLEYNWAFLLYYTSHWNKDVVYKLMDGQSTHQKVIFYVSHYEVKETDPESCEVCLCDVPLFTNSCGHKFCLECWKYRLQTSVFVDSTLFPRCQAQDCQAFMNYKLMEIIFSNPNNEPIKKKFQHLLFILYSRENNSTKICPNVKCGRQFLILQLRMKPIWCQCSIAICTLCGNMAHSPLDCAQIQNWTKMIEDNENKWIQIVQYKLCPKCKDPIEKNEGCNHMTCRCRHEFCWICLNDWKTHGVCHGWKAHEKMQEERKKMLKDKGKYRQKFENCKADTARYEAIIKRVVGHDTQSIKDYLMEKLQIPTHKTDFLADIPSLICLGYRFCENCKIYEFFRDENSLQGFHGKTVEKYCDELDDYMEKLFTTTKQLQQGSEKAEECQQEIKNLIYTEKSRIVELMSKTKQFILKLIDEG